MPVDAMVWRDASRTIWLCSETNNRHALSYSFGVLQLACTSFHLSRGPNAFFTGEKQAQHSISPSVSYRMFEPTSATARRSRAIPWKWTGFHPAHDSSDSSHSSHAHATSAARRNVLPMAISASIFDGVDTVPVTAAAIHPQRLLFPLHAPRRRKASGGNDTVGGSELALRLGAVSTPRGRANGSEAHTYHNSSTGGASSWCQARPGEEGPTIH